MLFSDDLRRHVVDKFENKAEPTETKGAEIVRFPPTSSRNDIWGRAVAETNLIV